MNSKSDLLVNILNNFNDVEIVNNLVLRGLLALPKKCSQCQERDRLLL